jgi:hypothetical protein
MARRGPRQFAHTAMKSSFRDFGERLGLIDNVILPGYAELT